MSGTAKFLLSITVLLTFPFLALAQHAQNQPARSIIVNVFDRQGNAVRDLDKENFRVRLNGKSAEVLDTHYSFAPRRIVVLLDMSGSMGGNSEKNKKWQIAREALEDLLVETSADVPIALLSFSDHVHDMFDFKQNRSRIAARLKQGTSQRSNIKGRTALRDAVLASLSLLQPVRAGDAIYAITDGGDNASHASATRTRTSLLESGVRLFTFLFAESPPTEEERAGIDDLVDMVGDSGGFVFGLPSNRGTASVSFLPSWDFEYDYNERTRDKIKVYTQALNIQVNGFYTLQVGEPLSRKDGKIKVEVVTKAGSVRKDVVFTYQRILLARR
jgi:Mg-chelatase subunit ChlD